VETALKKSIIATSLLLSATSGHADQGSAHFVLSPEVAITDGLERVIEYGVPISIEINEDQKTLDFSSFDDFVMRIPIEQALVQPNRTEPTK
jgi:hypothetical protein